MKLTSQPRNGYASLTGGSADKISEAKYGVSSRVAMVITNLNAAGGATIYIAIDEEASATKGIPLLPGQSITWSKNDNYNLPQGAVYGFAAAAGSTLSIYEEIVTGV